MEILRRLTDGYVTNEVAPEALPMIAAEALTRGVDSPSLRELAGLSSSDDIREIRDLYIVAMSELGIEMPAEDAVRWEQVRIWAHRIIDGSVSPYEGASQISAQGAELESPAKLSEIYYLTVLWEDNPERRQALEASMVEVAHGLT